MASLFGIVVLYNSRKKRKNMEDLMERMRNECIKKSGHGGCSQEITDCTDVIIVGAGVAGSALAYSLGKVSLPNPELIAIFVMDL